MRVNKLQKVCEQCSVEFFTVDVRKRFCSRSCSATSNNKARGGTAPMKNCLGVCSKKIQARGNAEYCSTSCRQAHKIELWWNDSVSFTTKEFPSWLRDILVYKGCEVCGWKGQNPFTQRPTCQIDHINGNSSDHSRKNVRVLCPNCHSLTVNYGALNKGNGRKHRYSA